MEGYIPRRFQRQPPLGKGAIFIEKGIYVYMKATGIVRRIDDLGRVVIPKEIRRTMRIREGDPSPMTLTPTEKRLIFTNSFVALAERLKAIS